MTAFRVTNPNEFASFMSAAEVVNPSSSPLAMKLTVRNAATHDVLANVNVTIEALSYTGVTSGLGVVQIASAPDGTYTGTLIKEGFASQPFTVNIVSGETFNVVVEMAPVVVPSV